ncbi:hypothetical protein EKL30_09825 [Candidimonas sp. SYP-B2681]|uniref:hypothetical protein n=1 Tax=Candidimonas sp. SYP-B2681 TaxID=2497686 RepID=UPI000F86759A|nr:hypothetical protein [Candidimonas sp. SYP-B2681]RTZ43174.1 hypothetical protein EKL30_09825 [Candidimonas sp. SYP-B2681]
MVSPSDNTETSYWLSKQLNITFSPYEDRLIIRAERGKHGVANLLLTRRMVMIVLNQLLGSLPELSGLNKTPAQYWQDVLQMSHQQAMEAKTEADDATATAAAAQVATEAPAKPDAEAVPKQTASPAIYLATELTVQRDDKQLVLAFRGLPMPRAMTDPCKHESVFASPLQLDHVHQLIQLLITKAQEAQWHLPLDLPWLESLKTQASEVGVPTVH